jgi:molybdopterin/thiamine biosynthesis adenylyltransferase
MALMKHTVVYPTSLDGSELIHDLHGFYHGDTRHIVIVDACVPGSVPLSSIGQIEAIELSSRQDGTLQFMINGVIAASKPYGIKTDLFSRHQGLLESEWMLDCRALICGCGSVGSLVALELARSGVGKFLLIDEDILSIENLCRHQCGLPDVGRYKALALSDRILQINPSAEVLTQTKTIETVDPSIIAHFTTAESIFLACADSRRADYYLARLASKLNAPFLSIGLWERAYAGEIFYQLPGEEHPCYSCAFEGLAGSVSQRMEQKRVFYTTEEEISKLSFQPAISTDISHVTQIGIKLAVDILNRTRDGYVPRILDCLSQYTLVCNTNDVRIGGEAAEIFSHPLQVTTSIAPTFGHDCPPCKLSF